MQNIFGQYRNPYYWWWKVRKYWKIPTMHLAHIGKVTWWYGLPINIKHYNKIFDIRLSGLGWKDKYDSPRHEWDPYLSFTLFRKWQIVFIWNFRPHFSRKVKEYSSISVMTWETILDMANYNKSVTDACHDSGEWLAYHQCDDPDYQIPPTKLNALRNLTRYGFEQYCQIPRSKELKEK